MSLYELEQISLAVMKDYKLKQKQHILNLFVQLYNAYVTEVQDMVDELRYFYESQERTLSSPNYISPSKSNIDQNYDSQIEEDPMVDFPLDLSKHHQPVTVDVQPQIHENLVLINKQSESNDDDSTDDEDRTKTLIQSLNSKTLINSAKSPVLGSIHPAPYIVENKHDDSNIIEKSTIIEASPDLLRRCTSTTTMNPFMNVKLPKKQRNDDWKMSKDVSNKQSTSLSPIPKRKKISSKKNKSNSKTSISSHLKQTTMTQVFDKIDKSTLPVQQLQFMLPLPVTRKLILPTVNYRKQSGQSKFILTGKKSSDANESLVIISATEQKQKRLLSPRKEQQLASEQMDTDENQVNDCKRIFNP
ncbi:unnamed protein product [Didymodactylos carnosus]|uniref:Uncharacterized protein n=1 Tax=Didymodactylos carnosus TaxID=1234261 RepID=A0A813R941_9BILA|nr:unnamed protein product [Didymodactylos carnosus]CAF0777702.1 unnamed protein product [Didymodactylos carnosus]CAF3527970.1 unnamed protein product [Didymodactylos carnosus]CAF3560435.1 unnamed protein product [Didymodactylos carnosus]